MLAAENRMRRSAEFARAFRGVRSGSARLLVAIGADSSDVDRPGGDSMGSVTDLPPKVGFVIPKSVGNSVVRHRLCRQLRHLMRMRIGTFHPGELVSVRVFPPAKGAGFQDLAADLDRCIASVRRKESLRKSGKESLRESGKESLRESGKEPFREGGKEPFRGSDSGDLSPGGRDVLPGGRDEVLPDSMRNSKQGGER